MLQSAWDEIMPLLDPTKLNTVTYDAWIDLKNGSQVHTKQEGNPHHYCSFFLPYDQAKGMIYLGHHIKADDWIPPGGHIEPGETPSDAAVREMMEELKTTITKDMLEPFNLSVKPIGRPDKGCLAHYDVWHLVHIPVQEFDYLKSEYHAAQWFTLAQGVHKITKNPDFANIITTLQGQASQVSWFGPARPGPMGTQSDII